MSYLGNRGRISTLNSTTTLLTSGSSFTGTWEDVSGYTGVIVALKTDQNGYYTIQFSPDGTNTDSSLTRYYRTTQTEPPHAFEITRKYCRVVFTNDSGSDQTYLRLQTKFVSNRTGLNIPMDATMSQDYDAIAVRPSNYVYEAALGRRQGATTWNKFGYNADVDIGTEVIAAFGGSFSPLTTASTLTIVSSSTDDDGSPAGTGANSIVIYGIDANRKSQTEVVTLNGTTNVVTATTWLGVNRAAIYLAGSTLTNVGNITITATTGGTVQAYLPAGEGTTQQLIYFTQADHQALADWLILNAARFNTGTEPIVTFKGWVYSAVSNAKYEVFRQVVDCNLEDHIELRPSQPFVIGEKSCFWIEATTQVNNTAVAGRFSLIEIRDVDA